MCMFTVQNDSWLHERRPCGGGGRHVLGEIELCTSHFKKLKKGIEQAISWGTSNYYQCSDRGQHREWYFLVKRALNEAEEEEKLRRFAEKQARTRASSVVYFMERDGFVKIGFTTSIRSRVTAVSKGSCLIDGMTVGPVRLLGTVPGGRGNEGYFHGRFAEYRIDGEWFLLVDEIWDFITGLKGYTGEPRSKGDSERKDAA